MKIKEFFISLWKQKWSPYNLIKKEISYETYEYENFFGGISLGGYSNRETTSFGEWFEKFPRIISLLLLIPYYISMSLFWLLSNIIICFIKFIRFLFFKKWGSY